MTIEEALSGVSRLFLDTAPVVYLIERNPDFIDRVKPIFARLDRDIIGVVSPITLAECLVYPIKQGLTDLEQIFTEMMTGKSIDFVPTDIKIAKIAATIRAKYNFQLPDSIQIATAISSDCDAFLTNDVALARVTEIRAIVVSKLSK